MVSATFGPGVREGGIHALQSADGCCRDAFASPKRGVDVRPTQQPFATFGLPCDAFAPFPGQGADVSTCVVVRESNP